MDEPNYNITNPDGELVGQIGADGNGNPVVSKPGGATVTITDDGIETPAVSTNNPPTEDDEVLRWQEGVEIGTISTTGTDRSGRADGWDSTTTTNITYTFDNEFSTAPNVCLTIDSLEDGVRGGYQVQTFGVSATDFTARYIEYHGEDYSSDVLAAQYIATTGR